MTDHWDRAAQAALVLERARAQTVACSYCHAPVGDPCVNPKTGAELGRLPAHNDRLRDVGA